MTPITPLSCLRRTFPALNVEAQTFEQFVEIVQDLTPDLVEDATGTIRFEREIELTPA